LNRPTFGDTLPNGTLICLISDWYEAEGLTPSAVVLCYRDWEPREPYCVWSIEERAHGAYPTSWGEFCATLDEAYKEFTKRRKLIEAAYHA
jgi:hypothetical protein